MLPMQYMGMQGAQLSGVPRASCFPCNTWVCKEHSSLACPALHASHAIHGYARSTALWRAPRFMLPMQYMGMQGAQLSGVPRASCFPCNTWVCKEHSSLACPALHASHAIHGYARSTALWRAPRFMLPMQYMGMQGAQLSGVPRASCFPCNTWVCKEHSSLACPTLHASHAIQGYVGTAAVCCAQTARHLSTIAMGMQGEQLSGEISLQGICQPLHGYARRAAVW